VLNNTNKKHLFVCLLVIFQRNLKTIKTYFVMKLKSNELEIGVEYYWSTVKCGKGIFVGTFYGSDYFYPTNQDGYSLDEDGCVGFSGTYENYEEV
jgi:hypothetical protein